MLLLLRRSAGDWKWYVYQIASSWHVLVTCISHDTAERETVSVEEGERT